METARDPASLPPHWEHFFGTAARVFVWVLLFSVIYFLRSFFLLLFLTFVFAYIQNNAVERLGRSVPSRTLRSIFVLVLLLSIIVAAGSFLVPAVKEQALVFANNYPAYLRDADLQLHRIAEKYPVVNSLVPQLRDFPLAAPEAWKLEHSPTAALLQYLLGMGETTTGGENVKQTLDGLRNLGVHLLAIGSAFLLSLLFSFLIVLDLPRIARNVRSLEQTRLRFIYSEVAESIYNFGSVLGRALEAQFFIALCNTALTAVGLWLLGLASKIAFLSMIVFFCSFIPIAGVFISSVPICLLALQIGGLGRMLLGVILITVIHLIEGYVLNPRIFGRHLRLNPVFVLFVLTIGGKLFGVWGLVLGLPICTYVLRHAIQYPDDEQLERPDSAPSVAVSQP